MKIFSSLQFWNPILWWINADDISFLTSLLLKKMCMTWKVFLITFLCLNIKPYHMHSDLQSNIYFIALNHKPKHGKYGPWNKCCELPLHKWNSMWNTISRKNWNKQIKLHHSLNKTPKNQTFCLTFSRAKSCDYKHN